MTTAEASGLPASGRDPAVLRLSQPTPKSCGQTVLAMLLGCRVEDIIVSMSDKRGTSAKQLIAHLSARGWRVSPRPTRVREGDALPPRCIVRVIWNEQRHRTHWMLHIGGEFFDPFPHPVEWNKRGGRIMSRIAVEPPC